jgi:hypothetical protein
MFSEKFYKKIGKKDGYIDLDDTLKKLLNESKDKNVNAPVDYICTSLYALNSTPYNGEGRCGILFGKFRDGFLYGEGIRYSSATSDNIVYEGTFEKSLKDGYGEEPFYKGKFKNGRKHGYGEQSNFHGHFANGTRHGSGKEFLSDDRLTYIEGHWQKGKLLVGEICKRYEDGHITRQSVSGDEEL